MTEHDRELVNGDVPAEGSGGDSGRSPAKAESRSFKGRLPTAKSGKQKNFCFSPKGRWSFKKCGACASRFF